MVSENVVLIHNFHQRNVMKSVRRIDILTLGLEGNRIEQGANKDGTRIVVVHIALKLASLTCFFNFFFQVQGVQVRKKREKWLEKKTLPFTNKNKNIKFLVQKLSWN